MERTAKEIIEALKPHEEALGDSFLSLVEDISDSVKQGEDMSKFIEVDKYNDVKAKYEDLKTKYIERFESGEPKAPPIVETPPQEPEKKPITIDDLFRKE